MNVNFSVVNQWNWDEVCLTSSNFVTISRDMQYRDTSIIL